MNIERNTLTWNTNNPPNKINHNKSHSVNATSSNKVSCSELRIRRKKIKRIIHPMLKISEQNINKIDKTPPYASSQSWAIFDCSNSKLLASKLPSSKREIASLTKIMVFYTCLKLI